jgi:hypothetical protein
MTNTNTNDTDLLINSLIATAGLHHPDTRDRARALALSVVRLVAARAAAHDSYMTYDLTGDILADFGLVDNG